MKKIRITAAAAKSSKLLSLSYGATEQKLMKRRRDRPGQGIENSRQLMKRDPLERRRFIG